MPAHPRRDLVDEREVGCYHCVARCVRRAFLCGDDAYSGQNFDHRKTWIRNRLEALAAIFGIEVVGFALMSNHLHVILRNRPDLTSDWTPEEIARRWRKTFRRRDAAAAPFESLPPTAMIECWRQRLSSVSWFMRCLCEPIARMANQEDSVSGRFWQGRFSSTRLLDESALLACAVYVDLNPIRAGIAQAPEQSEMTSVHERIIARQGEAAVSCGDENAPRGVSASDQDGWMAPLPLCGDPEPKASRNAGRRASNRGFLEMTLDEYLSVLDWAGRQLRAGKRGVISEDLPPILARLAVNASGWLECVREFGRWFGAAAGGLAAMSAHASRVGRRWLWGMRMSRLALG
jgi:REP element-mobilizing transposase RayT